MYAPTKATVPQVRDKVVNERESRWLRATATPVLRELADGLRAVPPVDVTKWSICPAYPYHRRRPGPGEEPGLQDRLAADGDVAEQE